MSIRVKVIGAGGYGGIGIVELLKSHPGAEIVAIVDVADIGKPISKLYPHLEGICDMPIVSAEDPKAKEPVDIVFMATPDGVGMKLAPAELKNGAKVIDYSGDFRFNSAESYSEYARRIGRETNHASPDLLPLAVYGVAELHRKELNTRTKLVGNPGCFAVSCILGLSPAVKNKIIKLDTIICDCKTATSGAGKKPSPTFHYPARYDNMNAYKLAGHQHICEIERELSLLAGTSLNVTFTAQAVPMCRGIMSSLYASLKEKLSVLDVMELYKTFYQDSPFVKMYDRESGIGTAQVRCTNYCKLIVDVDERTSRLRVISHIDNLMKGQAGSALQNMNLIMGLPETTGLMQIPKYP
jgi:N-acetyl-gamma-glutamyl-phosphate reductase